MNIRARNHMTRGPMNGMTFSAILHAGEIAIQPYQIRKKRLLDNPVGAWMNAWSGVSGAKVKEPANTYGKSLGNQWQIISWQNVNQFCRLPVNQYVEPDNPESGLLPEISPEPLGNEGDGDFNIRLFYGEFYLVYHSRFQERYVERIFPWKRTFRWAYIPKLDLVNTCRNTLVLSVFLLRPGACKNGELSICQLGDYMSILIFFSYIKDLEMKDKKNVSRRTYIILIIVLLTLIISFVIMTYGSIQGVESVF